MSASTVATGPGLPPDDVAALRQRQADVYADQCEAAVDLIEAKLAGMKESLAAAKAEAKTARSAARKGGAE